MWRRFEGKVLSIAFFRKLSASRLGRGSAANLLSLASAVVVQLLSVPILSAAFGLEHYGVWLLLTTIPTYLAMSDLGLNTVAQNELAILTTRGDEAHAMTVYQSVAMMVAGVCAIMFVSAVCFATIVSIHPGLVSPLLADHIWLVVVLFSYGCLGLFELVPAAALRGTGLYAWGTMVFEGMTFLESLTLMIVAVVFRNLEICALTLAVFRFVAVVVVWNEARRLRPYLRLGWTYVSGAEVKRLLPSALGLVAIPIGLALSLQGSALVVGGVLGPIAVATFVPVRTVSRLPLQFVGMITRATLPELGAAHGRGDSATERRLWRLNALLILAVLVPVVMVLALTGQWMIGRWTGGRIRPDRIFIILMAVTSIFHACWYTIVSLLATTHEHLSVARAIPLVCGAGILLAVPLTRHFGLEGTAASVLLVDLTLAAVAIARLQGKAGAMGGSWSRAASRSAEK